MIGNLFNRRTGLVAATVAGIVWAGVYAAGPVGAAPGGAGSNAPASSQAKGLPLSARTLPAAAGQHGLPRVQSDKTGKPASMEGVPNTGSYAFLLQLNTQSSRAAYQGALSRGKSAATSAEKAQT